MRIVWKITFYFIEAIILLLPISSIAQCVCIAPFGQDPTKFTMTFDDEFNGTSLNTAIWTDHTWYETSNSTKNYTVENGFLKIWPQRDASNKFFTRTVVTQGKFSQSYGYFEAELKAPYGKGIWPAFWLLGHPGPSSGHVDWPEVDIFETYGDTTGGNYWADANFHPTAEEATVFPVGAGYGPGFSNYVSNNGDLSTSFHKYGVLWESTKASFYFDGTLVAIVYKSMSSQMYILLDLALSAAGGADNTTPTGKSNSFEINYVRAWKLGGPGCTTTTASILETAKDEKQTVEDEKQTSISIYPNPFNGNFTLKISPEIILKNAALNIYDVSGKEVKTISITRNVTTISGDELKKGDYFYQFISNNELISSGKLLAIQ